MQIYLPKKFCKTWSVQYSDFPIVRGSIWWVLARYNHHKCSHVAGSGQEGFDGSGRRSCKSNYVDFYKEAHPHADTAWAVVG